MVGGERKVSHERLKRNINRKEKGRWEPVKYIMVTMAIKREGHYYVAKCVELGTSSFGCTQDEALANIIDATELYLNTLEDLGECGQILEEREVTLHGEAHAMIVRTVPNAAVASATIPLREGAFA